MTLITQPLGPTIMCQIMLPATLENPHSFNLMHLLATTSLIAPLIIRARFLSPIIWLICKYSVVCIGGQIQANQDCAKRVHTSCSNVILHPFSQALTLTPPPAPDIYPSLARLPTNQIAAIFVVMTTFTSNLTSQCFPAMF